MPHPQQRAVPAAPGWADLRRLEHLLGSCRRQGRLAAVLLIELQPADPDSAGALVQAVAQRLRCRVRGSDETAQIDGTSLAVLLLDAGERGSNGVRERLGEQLRAPYRVGTDLRLPLLRIGRAVHGLDGHHVTDLLQAATLVRR
jgi:GGDEF domain-containing protein